MSKNHSSGNNRESKGSKRSSESARGAIIQASAPVKAVQVDKVVKRKQKWISFMKPRTVLGFEKLPRNLVPVMGGQLRGLSLCFEKIQGWSVPVHILHDIDSNDFEVTVQLSLSMFHVKSKTFFGSTWMGSSVPIWGSNRDTVPDVVDIDYGEIVYMTSHLTDPSCVAVAEIVVSKIDKEKNVLVDQHGCGWTMVPLFANNVNAVDVSLGYLASQQRTSALYTGSPRDLLAYDVVEKGPNELQGCTLHYRLFQHNKLLRAKKLVSENEIIGRFEVVAGLAQKTVTLPGELRSRRISCIGDNEEVGDKKGVYVTPATPQLLEPLRLQIIEWHLLIPNRVEYESRIRTQVTKRINNIDASKSRITSRRLKLGIHNGHRVISNNGEWTTIQLEHDEDDPDVLLTPDDLMTIDIGGYFAHELVALVMLVEYEVGVPLIEEVEYGAQTTVKSTQRHGNSLISTVTIGGAAYIPFNGQTFELRNMHSDSEALASDDNEDLNIELELTTDDVCQLLSQNLIFKDRTTTVVSADAENTPSERYHDDKVDSSSELIAGFDLKVFDKRTEYKDGDEYTHEGIDEWDDVSKEGKKPDHKPKIRPSTKNKYIDDDVMSVSTPSIVTGGSDASALRLDCRFYQYDQDDVSSIENVVQTRPDKLLTVVPGQSSLLSRSLQTFLGKSTERVYLKDKDRDRGSDILEDRRGDERSIVKAPISRSAAPVMAVSGSSPYVRDISRASRSRLSRHGFVDSAVDSSIALQKRPYIDNTMDSTKAGLSNGVLPVDVELEANDSLSMHEINIQFAAYRAAPTFVGTSPRSVYFSYQFFSFRPTRTEVMRLLPTSDKGEFSVLVREESTTSRNEVPLVLRYMVDGSSVSSLENYDLAEYLAHRSLFIDVWDANSLMLVGTASVPLRKVMRQGKPQTKCTLECDVICSDTHMHIDHRGICTTVICDGCPPQGSVVGSIQLIISNTGSEGKSLDARADSKSASRVDVDRAHELNWRACSVSKSSRTVRKRPQNSVRAKPLSENSPELYRVLEDHRHTNDAKFASMRSLSAIRGGEGMHTLTYDDVIILFKRFQGSVKGTIQYDGPMMKLLDVPSWSVTIRKLVKLYKKTGSQGDTLRKKLMEYADASGCLRVSDFEEVLTNIFARYGIACRTEEISIIAKKVAKFGRNSSTSETMTIVPDDFLNFCVREADRQDWAMASRRVKRAIQKATLSGVDVEQLLAEKDDVGNDMISIPDFKLFLKGMSKYGKVSAMDIDVLARHFAKDVPNVSTPMISLKEIAAFIGKSYVGNVEARLRNVILSHGNSDKSKPSICKETALLLAGYSDSREEQSSRMDSKSIGEKFRIHISVDDMESRLKRLGAYDVLSHDQVRNLLFKVSETASTNGQGNLSPVELINYLKIDVSGVISTSQERVTSRPACAEDLLRMLLDRASNDGATIDQAFRHFDTDGDGFITESELLQGLDTLHVFDSIPNWKSEVPSIVAKFDKSGDGAVSLNEFFMYLGAEKYIPNIMQRMTKIFATSNVPLQDIFSVFDSKNQGFLTVEDLRSGLEEIGGFQEVSNEDIESIISHFDDDGDGQISLSEFISYFGERVKQAKKERKEKKIVRLQRRFREVITAVVEDGGTLEQIFDHFDKDSGGSLSTDELASGLRSLKHFNKLTSDDTRDLISLLDTDKDGTISFSEFKQFVSGSNSSARPALTRLDSFSSKSRPIIERLHDIVMSAKAKGKSPDDVFSHLDKNKDGTLTLEELKEGLKRIRYFAKLDDDDYKELFRTIDYDNSGEISVSEFIDVVVNCKLPAATLKQESTISRSPILTRLHDIVMSAKAKGKSPDDVFAHLDKNKDGTLTLEELKEGLKRIRYFAKLDDDDYKELFRTIDYDNSGEISVSEFIDVVVSGRPSVSSNQEKAAGGNHLDDESMLLQRIKQVANRETGGIHGIVAFLDDDEDGLFKLSDLMRFLAAEGVFDRGSTLSQEKVKVALKDIIRRDNTIRVDNFLRYVSGNKSIEDEFPSRNREDDDEDDLADSNDFEYEFSREPETRALEKKMRDLGNLLAKKGVDIESMFRSYDARYSGMVRRTEFLEILSKMGLYILEQGNVIEDGKSLFDTVDNTGMSRAVRKQQERQISRLKRGNRYSDSASKVAGQLVKSGRTGDFKEHLESLALIDWYRQGQKRMLLQRVLSHSLASSVQLYPRFGCTLFFEHPLTNPFGHEERFLIEINDPELRIVTDYAEWSSLRNTCRPCTGTIGAEPVEAEMFDGDGVGSIQVSLLAHETVHVPFTFLTLKPDVNSTLISKAPSKRRQQSKSSDAFAVSTAEAKAQHDDAAPLRVIDVRFISGSHGHVVAVLRVHIYPRSCVVNRNLIYYESENSIMKRRIQLRSGSGMQMYPGEDYMASKYVHCVECSSGSGSENLDQDLSSQLLVEWGPSDDDCPGALDLIVRYRCPSFPGCGTFYVLLYNDPYQCSLYEIWHVTVHSRQRLDMNCTVGSRKSVDLVVRGDRYSRRVRAFCSPNTDNISFQPESYFQLVPGAYNRVVMTSCPKAVGTSRAQLNVVDVDTKELVSSWLLVSAVSAPVVMRTYDVDIPIGKPLHKKIIFKNPWNMTRRFNLVSSNESVMKPRNSVLEVAGHGNAYLKLWFSGGFPSQGATQVYLFLNDDTGHNEECFLFDIKVAM